MNEQTINPSKVEIDLVNKVEELSKENQGLRISFKELDSHCCKLEQTCCKLEQTIKSYEEELSNLHKVCEEQQETIDGYKTPDKNCIKDTPEEFMSHEEKRKRLYKWLDKERNYLYYRIMDFKQDIIVGDNPDLAEIKLRDAKKQFRQVKRIIKQVLKY